MEAAPLLTIRNVTKRFGETVAVDDVSIDIAGDTFFALLGPSGCGKSTLMRMIAGFETPDTGRILLDGAEQNGVPPHRRPVNMMFQSYALFPHMSVEGNIAFGLRQDGLPRETIAERVAEMLALVQLDGLGARRPHQLSGGQRQRVALARALAKRPKLLLLDEPMAALDKKLRGQTQAELAQLRRRLGTTFVIVTHDQEEAMTLADRMAVMERGRIAQVGTPRDIYERPASRYVASFIGEINLIEGTLTRASDEAVEIDTPAGLLRASAPAEQATVGQTVTLALRPEQLRLTATPIAGVPAIKGTVAEIAYLGDRIATIVQPEHGPPLKAVATSVMQGETARPAIGDVTWLTWPARSGVVLTR